MKKSHLIILASLFLFIVSFFILKDDSGFMISDIEHVVPNPSEGIKIIALGDSLTAGYGLSKEDSYPSILETKLKGLGLNVLVVNEGVNGDVAGEVLARVDDIKAQEPNIVLLGIGGNDALRSIDLDQTYNNLDQTILSLKAGENAPVVILLQMKAPITSGLGYVEKFNSMYEELSKKHKILLLPFMTSEVFLDKNNKISDGIHFNREGYEKIVDLYLLETLVEVVEKIENNISDFS
ncbi:MAG: arylesterase [Candidatus Paceibacterota bacterium]